jgi:ATP-dependent Clp endopeptidase proteolytic subunit ClpP
MSNRTLDDNEILFEQDIHIPSQTIMLTGEVNERMYDTLVKGLILIENRHKEATNITIELNSPGGSWYDGAAIHDRIKSYRFPVTIKASGMAMSMGSIILQAGDKRLLTPSSTVMVHDGSEVVEGSPDNVMAWAKHSKDVCGIMYKIYADASGKTEAFWKKRCKKDFILSADQAIKLGLADGLIE